MVAAKGTSIGEERGQPRHGGADMSVQIVIIGGGFGGLEAAMTLAGRLRGKASLTLIDRNAVHTFSPSIHEVVSGKTTTGEIQLSLQAVLEPAGVAFLQEAVRSIRPEQRTVDTAARQVVYDYLVIAAGAESNTPGLPGADAGAFTFRSPVQAERIQTELDRLLLEQGRVRIVLAGGGTEGVEVGGEIADRIDSRGRGKDLEEGEVSVSIIEGQPRLLPCFPSGVGEFAGQYLKGRGVTVLTGERIAALEPGQVTLQSGRSLRSDLLIWTGGIRPSALIRNLSLAKDRNGWLLVDEMLRCRDDARIFGVGDAVSIRGPEGTVPVPRLAYHALDQAAVAGGNIASAVAGGEMQKYRPRQRRQLISLGRNMGISATAEGFVTGAWVVGLKKAVERAHLLGYLGRPLVNGILSRIPGAGILDRLRSNSGRGGVSRD